jgi:hypothetical protein
MGRRDLILELCHEAGDSGPEYEIVEDWEANHACCCNLHIDNAAQGDGAMLSEIRRCMGLPLTR